MFSMMYHVYHDISRLLGCAICVTVSSCVMLYDMCYSVKLCSYLCVCAQVQVAWSVLHHPSCLQHNTTSHRGVLHCECCDMVTHYVDNRAEHTRLVNTEQSNTTTTTQGRKESSTQCIIMSSTLSTECFTLQCYPHRVFQCHPQSVVQFHPHSVLQCHPQSHSH